MNQPDNPQVNPQLNIAIALMSEAKPIIDRYRLKPVRGGAFSFYRGAVRRYDINLIITGLGRVAMATAVGWLAAGYNKTQTAWLNIGTAGHRSETTGTILRVAQCENVIGDRALFLPLVAPWKGGVASLITTDQLGNGYPDTALVDMEGSAFFRAATLFAPSELVQSLKVVSDNADSDLSLLNGAALTDFIAENIEVICAFMDGLMELATRQPAEQKGLEDFVAAMQSTRMTTSQRLQVEDLANKLLNTGISLNALLEMNSQSADASRLIRSMSETLEATPPVIHG